MSFLSQSNRPTKEAPKQEPTRESAPGQTSWSELLQEVTDEQNSGQPWWKRALMFWAWAGGFAGSAAVVVVIVILIAELFSRDRVFTARVISDWMFWASAALMLFGLVSPSSSDLQDASSKKKKSALKTQEDRTSRSLRRRLRRAYDPWRWRLWASALLTFGLSALIGLLT